MKKGLKFSHFGVPTTDKSRTGTYLEGAKVWINDFNDDPYAVEWLCFEDGSPFPELIQKVAHVAYEVDDLVEAMKGAEVLVAPFPVGDNLTCAFIAADGHAVELMEFKK